MLIIFTINSQTKIKDNTIASHNVNMINDSLVAQMVKNLPVMPETWVQPLGQEDPLEKK